MGGRVQLPGNVKFLVVLASVVVVGRTVVVVVGRTVVVVVRVVQFGGIVQLGGRVKLPGNVHWGVVLD